MECNEKTYVFSEKALNSYIKAIQKLARIEERNACYEIIFEYAGRDDLSPEDESLLKVIADLIRARGLK